MFVFVVMCVDVAFMIVCFPVVVLCFSHDADGLLNVNIYIYICIYITSRASRLMGHLHVENCKKQEIIPNDYNHFIHIKSLVTNKFIGNTRNHLGNITCLYVYIKLILSCIMFILCLLCLMVMYGVFYCVLWSQATVS